MARKSDAVIEPTSNSGIKKLTIEYDKDGIPKFEFCGSWTGKDLVTVSRLLLRAYRRNQRTTRREQPITKQEETK